MTTEMLTHWPVAPVQECATPPEFSSRKIEVLELTAKGWGDKEIAAKFTVSPTTIGRDKKEIEKILGTKSTFASLMVAVEREIISPSEIIKDLGLDINLLKKLTNRQIDVLQTMITYRDSSYKLIAKLLCCDDSTISSHSERIRETLGKEREPLSDITTAVILFMEGIKQGIINSPIVQQSILLWRNPNSTAIGELFPPTL